MKSIKPSISSGIFLFFLIINTLTAQWVQVPNGMGNKTVNAFTVNGNYLFAGTNSGIYVSTNNGANWDTISFTGQNVYSLGTNGNYLFAGLFYVYVSSNNGANWTQTSINQPVSSFAFVGNNAFAGWIANSGVYKSTNNGTNWAATSLSGFVLSLASNANTIFAGRYQISLRGVYKSTDNGTSWTQTSLNSNYVRSLAVKGDTVFAGTINPVDGIFRSTDNGTSWTQTSLNNRYVWALAIDGNNVYAGTFDYGVYVSNDNGMNWMQRNEGLGNDTVYALCIMNNYLFAGKRNQGVYRRPLGELTGIKPISSEIPSQYSLSQNYPNPFNPATKIKFEIPNSKSERNQKTEIRIYDILGKEVAVLVNEQLQPGTYEVEWNAGNFPSGIYYYTLTAGEFSETKKAVLIK